MATTPAPGSVRKITTDDLRDAWSRRETDREGSLAVFRDAVYSHRRRDICSTLNITSGQLQDFLAPRLPAELTEDIKKRAAGHKWDVSYVDSLLGQLRGAGWSIADLARSLGVPRPRIAALNPSGELPPKPGIPAPDRIRFVSLATVPAYIFTGGQAPRATRSSLPDSEVANLRELDARLGSDRDRAWAAKGDPEHSKRLWAVVKRSEENLVQAAMRLSWRTGVSMTALSLLLRESNRMYLPRMARRLGHDVHVPPSVEKVSAVRDRWEPSRATK